jgi:tetratricopeptide (TPR) repeat protein
MRPPRAIFTRNRLRLVVSEGRLAESATRTGGSDLAAGQGERALELMAELEQRPHVRGSASYPAFLPGLVRTAVAAGDLALGNRLASGLEPLDLYQEHALVASGAILAEARGDIDEAARLYSEAAERWGQFGVVPEQAFALLGLGRCLLALGDPAAGEALRQARDLRQAGCSTEYRRGRRPPGAGHRALFVAGRGCAGAGI